MGLVTAMNPVMRRQVTDGSLSSVFVDLGECPQSSAMEEQRDCP
jgi:hypothetical protein